MRYSDWGERSPRWAGIRSETVDITNSSVHLLRADRGPDAPPDAPSHLLIHPMAAGAIMWLDVIRPLTAHGPVIAPDLPGSLFGHTSSPHWRAARAEPSARFLRALLTALDPGPVVVHGWSMGGLVAVHLADIAPGLVSRLNLVNPALPGPLTTAQKLGWRTVGQAAFATAEPIMRGLVRTWGRRMIDYNMTFLTDPEKLREQAVRTGGGDLSRLSEDNVTLWGDRLRELRTEPRKMSNAVTAFSSATSAMFINRHSTLAAIDRVAAPTRLLWGDEDPMITRAVIDFITDRRPDWDLNDFHGAGHLLPLELPDAYADASGR
jgi:pimeloyl-ACP methyl ester carboxylesterase